MSLGQCGKENPGAGIGIGYRVVMLERDFKVRAHIGQGGGFQIPGFPGQLDGAYEWQVDLIEPIGIATSPKDRPVK